MPSPTQASPTSDINPHLDQGTPTPEPHPPSVVRNSPRVVLSKPLFVCFRTPLSDHCLWSVGPKSSVHHSVRPNLGPLFQEFSLRSEVSPRSEPPISGQGSTSVSKTQVFRSSKCSASEHPAIICIWQRLSLVSGILR